MGVLTRVLLMRPYSQMKHGYIRRVACFSAVGNVLAPQSVASKLEYTRQVVEYPSQVS